MWLQDPNYRRKGAGFASAFCGGNFSWWFRKGEGYKNSYYWNYKFLLVQIEIDNVIFSLQTEGKKKYYILLQV